MQLTQPAPGFEGSLLHGVAGFVGVPQHAKLAAPISDQGVYLTQAPDGSGFITRLARPIEGATWWSRS
ncbi:MAG: hypothetical protein ACREOY_00510 [Candidatus Dormibacteraceae bacterium]